MLKLNKWKYPDGTGFDISSTFPLVAGENLVDIPASLLQRYRNFTVEYLFTGITAGDLDTNAELYQANHQDAYLAPNIAPVGEGVDFDATIVANTEAVFVREFKNMDVNFARIVITAPSGVTCSVIINVSAGGQSL